MARYSQGPTGAFIGKLGPVIGGTWKGKPYLRSRPVRTAKATARELVNRDKFKALHIYLQPLLYILRAGFKGYSPTVEGYNAAKSYNLRNAFTMVDKNYQLDPSKVLVSYGSLPLPSNLSCKLVGKELHFSWENTQPGSVEDPYDRTMLVAYRLKVVTEFGKRNITVRKDFSISGSTRKAGKDVLEIAAPGSYHIYFAFLSDDRTKQSNSCYLGVVEVG
jgi:hypothetical protein